jgi:hypothetical protein
MDVSPIVVDLETCGLENAADFLEPIPDAVPDTSPVEADKRLTDPAKIAADIEKKLAAQFERNREAQLRVEQQRQDRLQQAALDWNVGRIVALGWWTEQQGVIVEVCKDDHEEYEALGNFWEESRHRTIVGFAIKSFDLRYLVQRSRLLRVPHPMLDFSKYSRRGVTDLHLDLTFGDGTYDKGAMRRTLKAFAKRFGIPVNDQINGAEIPALVAAGDWAAVEAHCRADVELTVQLAQRLGIVQEIPIPVEQAVL